MTQDFLQVLSMFAGFGFAWPPQVLTLMNTLSLFNFNFDLLAPECRQVHVKYCLESPHTHTPVMPSPASVNRGESVTHVTWPWSQCVYSVSINFETKWYIIQALPLTLTLGITVVVVTTKALQWLQRTVLGVLPFGALSVVSLADVCFGMLISGIFMLYFGMPSRIGGNAGTFSQFQLRCTCECGCESDGSSQ